jgi:stage II sporulation protein D
VSFEEYAVGVMAAVLPSDSSEEMMKVMAVIVRTYVAYMSPGGRSADSQQLGQPWLSAGERLAKGLDDEKLKKAVSDTRGYKILYNGEPILPLYYALSNGRTRNFQDVWGAAMPYLKSVESSWDKSSADYVEKRFVSRTKIRSALTEVEEALSNGGKLTGSMVQIVEKDDSGYIRQIQIAGQVYTGEEVRCRLGLASACFDYEVKNDGIEFICYGRGHGVGLSLYGAEAMAEEGKSWQEIISWYFPGTSV